MTRQFASSQAHTKNYHHSKLKRDFSLLRGTTLVRDSFRLFLVLTLGREARGQLEGQSCDSAVATLHATSNSEYYLFCGLNGRYQRWKCPAGQQFSNAQQSCVDNLLLEVNDDNVRFSQPRLRKICSGARMPITQQGSFLKCLPHASTPNGGCPYNSVCEENMSDDDDAESEVNTTPFAICCANGFFFKRYSSSPSVSAAPLKLIGFEWLEGARCPGSLTLLVEQGLPVPCSYSLGVGCRSGYDCTAVMVAGTTQYYCCGDTSRTNLPATQIIQTNPSIRAQQVCPDSGRYPTSLCNSNQDCHQSQECVSGGCCTRLAAAGTAGCPANSRPLMVDATQTSNALPRSCKFDKQDCPDGYTCVTIDTVLAQHICCSTSTRNLQTSLLMSLSLNGGCPASMLPEISLTDGQRVPCTRGVPDSCPLGSTCLQALTLSVTASLINPQFICCRPAAQTKPVSSPILCPDSAVPYNINGVIQQCGSLATNLQTNCPASHQHCTPVAAGNAAIVSVCCSLLGRSSCAPGYVFVTGQCKRLVCAIVDE